MTALPSGSTNNDAAVVALQSAVEEINSDLIYAESVTELPNVKLNTDIVIENINSEGNKQISAIQSKGDNVLSSIPNDYSDLVNEVDELKSDISNLEKSKNLCFAFSKTNCNVKGYYGTESLIKGLGFYAKNIPQYIESIKVTCNCNANGTVKLDILDSNKNEIFTTFTTVTNYSSGVQTLIFNVNEFIYEEKIWIRVYSDTINIGRCEPTALNTKIVDTSCEYACYLVNGNWNYASYYNYIPECTIIGSITKKSLFVGTNHQFTKIKDAVDYANEHINSGWDILIESGTYDIYEEFGGDTWYTAITSASGNMQGLLLGNNVNLIGIGNVKLTLNAPDNLATSSNVPNLSVIELPNENNIIENITIECKNVRYGIHDETNGIKPNSKRKLKNVHVTHNGCVSGTWNSGVSYGCGTSNNSHFEYYNCIFENGWLAHQNSAQTIPPRFYANNCKFGGGSYAISLNTSGTCKAEITFNNCYIDHMIRVLENTDVWKIYGSGNNEFNYVLIGNDKSFNPFNLYNATIKRKNIGVEKILKGSPVRIYKHGVSKSDNAKLTIGIALNEAETGESVVVQTKGFYDCYTTAPFSEDNTLLGVSNGVIVEDNNNYFAIGVYVDDMQAIYLLK